MRLASDPARLTPTPCAASQAVPGGRGKAAARSRKGKEVAEEEDEYEVEKLCDARRPGGTGDIEVRVLWAGDSPPEQRLEWIALDALQALPEDFPHEEGVLSTIGFLQKQARAARTT